MSVTDIAPLASLSAYCVIEEVTVNVSDDASVVKVIPEPAANVNVSVVPSAAIFDCPDTAIVENKF